MKRTAIALVAWIATAATAVAQPAPPPPPPPPGGVGNVGEWYAQNVNYDRSWRPDFYGPTGLDLEPSRPGLGPDGRLNVRARVELMTPETLDGFGWRSAEVIFDYDCKTFAGSSTAVLFSGQNLTGSSHPAPAGARVTRRPVDSLGRILCVRANKLEAERKANPDEAEGPVTLSPAELATWTSRNLQAEGWGEPLFGELGVLYVKPGAKGVAELRKEYFDPAELTLGLARSLREQVNFDCTARTWAVKGGTYYPRRNLAGTGQALYPVRVVSFDSEPALPQRALAAVCGAGSAGRAADFVPAVTAQNKARMQAQASAVSAAKAKPITAALAPPSPAARDAATVEAWLKQNVASDQTWTPLVIGANGITFIRPGLAPKKGQISLELRMEQAFPGTSIGPTGDAWAERSRLGVYKIDCRSGVRYEAVSAVGYEGQNLTGAARSSVPGMVLSPMMPIAQAMCGDTDGAKQAPGPGWPTSAEAVQAWGVANLAQAGWRKPVLVNRVLVSIEDKIERRPDGRSSFRMRAEYIDPILSNVAGSWFIARSAMEQVAFNCGTGGFERSDLRFYGARNLQGAEHLASDTVMAGERGALSQLPPALKVEVCAAG